ncbi:MAG: glycosyltransferase family 2 protein [Tyzzerella sp.]|uniref:Glycosyltransferase family 2 protein n=1 Tax=Candidatus Fimicola merdigallinarum TaxID=2840819 RepID=A0A9D9DV85_9FIRM|nr:glycosyltransferase family 2 protein [Candidatus Fimicola merdigallinarum]
MKNNVEVSLIIPVYNVEKYIDKCLKSAVNQTFKDMEIIIVNDGSTDNSIEIVNRYIKKYDNIKLISQENKGLSSARNVGIKESSGNYIAFADSDDYFSKKFIEDMYNTIINEKSDIVVCGFKRIDENKKPNIKNRKLKYKTISSDKALDMLINDIFINNFAWNKLYKKELFTENDIYFPEGKTYEDMYVMYKLFHKSKKISIINKKLYCYVQRKSSITYHFKEKNFYDILGGLYDMKSYLIDNNIYKKHLFSYHILTLKNLALLIYRIIFSKDMDTRKKLNLFRQLKKYSR